MAPEPYRQSLPALRLSLERHTDRVPPDGGWYLLVEEAVVSRHRTKAAAQEAWKAYIAASGWEPERRTPDAKELMLRESAERWSRNRGG